MKYLLFILLLTSCSIEKRIQRRCAKCPTKTETKDSIYTQVKDTTIYKDSLIQLPADSAWYYALIECVNNKPVIKSEKSKQGTSTTFKTSHKSDSTQLQIHVDCDREKQELTVRLKEKYEKEYSEKSHTQKETVTVTVNILTWWQKFLMWCGGIFLVYAAFRIGYFIAKKQFPLLKFFG